MSKKILLVVNTNTYFASLMPVAKMLKRSGKYFPVIFFSGSYPTISRDIDICKKEEISYICEYTFFNQRNSLRTQLTQIMAILRNESKGYFIFSIICNLWYFQSRCKFIERLLQQLEPALIILAGDIVSYDTAIFIKVGHKKKILSVVIPSWMASALEQAEALFDNPDFNLKKWSNWIVGSLYPRWVYKHNGRKLLRLPAGRAIAMELLGLAPPLPWILHSGYADAIAIESEAMRQYCIHEGLSPDKLVLTGSLANDIMQERLSHASIQKKALNKRLGLSSESPLILCALPPDQLYGLGRPDCDFKSYNDLVTFWIESLLNIKGYNIVLCLHPSVSYEEIKYVEKCGVKIARDSTAELIPLCDIFVASISATIQWAIACGKPVINYDVYRYKYTDYDGVEGVITVEEKSEFISILKRMSTNPDFYKELTDKQKANSEFWGKLDGNSAKRLLALFDRLIETSSKGFN